MKRLAVPEKMRAMILERPGVPLRLQEVPVPSPAASQVLVRVHACGVCRTDLHIVDGELPDPKSSLIPGHQVTGTVAAAGVLARRFQAGDNVGVSWLGATCGRCRYCLGGKENLCDTARFTGYTADGGFAEYCVADEAYCFLLPAGADPVSAAPLLCAGLIGYRSYRMAGEGVERLGLYGFGAAAHIVAQIAVWQGKGVYAFTRPGDAEAQGLARELGAIWAGDSSSGPPEELDAAILFAPVGALLPLALQATAKGGTVVCGGIHMSDIPSFPYSLLWGERVIRSVANLTRKDAEELLALAPKVPIVTETAVFGLEQANEALESLRAGRIHGAAVIRVSKAPPE